MTQARGASYLYVLFALLLAAGSLACDEDSGWGSPGTADDDAGDDDDDVADDDDGDDDVATDVIDVEVQISEEIPTVATLRWDAAGGADPEGFVRFGLPGELDRVATATLTDDGRFEVVLFGLKADHGYEAQVVDEDEDGERIGESVEFETG